MLTTGFFFINTQLSREFLVLHFQARQLYCDKSEKAMLRVKNKARTQNTQFYTSRSKVLIKERPPQLPHNKGHIRTPMDDLLMQPAPNLAACLHMVSAT